MELDTGTLLASLAAIELAGAIILAFFWIILSKRNEVRADSLLWWIAGLLLAAAGTYLIALRGSISDVWSIVAANALLFLATGMRRAGFASILQQPGRFWVFVAAAGLWLVCCTIPEFYGSFVARVNFVQSCLAASCLWLVWMALRSNHERLYSVSLLAVTSALEAAAYIWFMSHQNLSGFGDVFRLPADNVTSIYLLCITMALVMTAVLPVGMVIEILVLRYKEQAYQDPLTGLPNRRSFWNSCHTWLSKDDGKNRKYGFILFDIDGLQKTNDMFGPAMGDAVLQLFGKVAREAIGKNSFAGRIGGEEFAVFLPDLDAKDSLVVAQRVSRRLGVECEEASGGKLIISAGAGVVSAGPGFSPERSFEMAGRLLLRAKKQGRGQIMIAETSQEKGSILSFGAGPGSGRRRTAA